MAIQFLKIDFQDYQFSARINFPANKRGFNFQGKLNLVLYKPH